MAKSITNTQHYSDIATAIRTKTGRTSQLKPSEMAAEIQSIVTSTPESWSRSADIPDYSQVTLGNSDEVIYLTYDTTIAKLHSNFVSFGISGSATIVEWGTLTNGTFTIAGTATLANNGTYRAWLPTNLGRYVVYRIRPSATAHITRYYLNNSDITIGSQRINTQKQPLIEVYCRLPYVNTLAGYLVSYYTLSYIHYGSISVTNMSNAFAYGYSLENIYFEQLNTQNCTTFAGAFRNCYRLKHIDLDLSVTNKCTNLSVMFYCNRQIQNFPFDFSSWDVSKVTTFADMFNGCVSVHQLNVASWNVIQATSFSSSFANCQSLRIIDISQWYAPKCTTVYSMFASCSSLEYINLSGICQDLITTVRYAVYNCGSLKRVNVSNLVKNKCTDIREVFSSDTNLIEIIGLDTWDTSAAIYMSSCFYNTTCLSEVDISSWNLSSVTTLANAGSVFRYSAELEKLALPSTLNYLGQYFVSNTSEIREYHFLNPTPASLYDATLFPKYVGMKMYVPVGSLNAYKTAWSGYVDYLREEGT